MRILGFDTATRATTVALSDSERGDLQLEARDDPPRGERPRHVTRLLALIADVLERSGAGWEGIDLIAVGVGPGTFTGLRIGVATARALARARGIPLVGISTLHSLARNGTVALERAAGPDAVLAVLDARRGEVFTAGWRSSELSAEVARGDRSQPITQSGGRQPAGALLPAQALSPEALAALVPDLGSSTLAIGDGAVEFRAVLERSGSLIPEDDSELHRVTAINHCRLAGGMRGSAADEIHPEYLRLPDAEIARRAAGSR